MERRRGDLPVGAIVETVKIRKRGWKATRGEGEKLQRAGYPAQPTGTEPTDKQKLELEHEQKGASDMSNSPDKSQTRPDK
jgi:hypothetical protein